MSSSDRIKLMKPDSYAAVSASEDDSAGEEVVDIGEQQEENKKWYHKIFEGGSVFDGFLLAASQEIGQVILTLPYTFSLIGMTSGVVMELFFATLALYTNYLLIALLSEYRHIINTDPKHPHHKDPMHIVSYHEIIGGLIGEKVGSFTRVIIYIALIGVSTVQIIATSSNFHIMNNHLTTRDWSLLWGFVFMFMLFIPNFRHYRAMSILGVLSTTYTAWFMTIQAAVDGPTVGVTYSAPDGVLNYFRGLTGIIFCFGGHSASIEKADVLNDHTAYDQSYLLCYLYVFTLTIPNAVSVYYRFGDQTRDNANAFHLFEPSPQRDLGIILMSLHQMVAFGLYTGPIYHLWEKYLGVYNKSYWTRISCRFPVAAGIVLLAVAFPFYAAVNDIFGAFTTSLATYIIPLAAYNYVFQSRVAQQNMVKKPAEWVDMRWMLWINWVLIGIVFVGGVCLGGYAAFLNFGNDVKNLSVFPDCYDCDDE